MIKIAKINKNAGKTMAQIAPKAISILGDEKVSFAGRLDPMAQGLVIFLLAKDENYKSIFLNLEKVYSFNLILGIATDSFDPLGLLTDFKNVNTNFEIITDDWLAENFCQKFSAPYPPFSSRKISGKPLFTLTKQNKIPDIWPKKEVEIYQLEIKKSLEIISLAEYLKPQLETIKKITGDFRQDEIIENWKNFLNKYPNFKVGRINILAKTSSGTYVRWLATEIGKKLACPAIASDINRLSIGSITYSDKDELASFDFEDLK